MNEAEDGVAGGHVLGDNADGQQIVDLIEGNLGSLLLLKDGIEALDAPLDAGLDAVFAQLLGERVFHAAQELLALDAPGFNGCSDLLIAHRIGVAEGQVFQFAAHFAHAQPVSQRRVNVERLAGDGLLAVGLQMLERAHVVQPVGQLDEHHAHIRDHGQQHLAHVFCLAVLAIGELDFVDLGDALDDVGHLVAEAGGNLLIGGGSVFHRVVQQARGDGGRVHLHLRQHFGHFKRMNNVRLARGAHLPVMMLDAELPRLADQRNVFGGPVGVDLLEQCLQTPAHGLLIDLAHHRLRLPRRSRDRARYLCRNGLPDSRHAPL